MLTVLTSLAAWLVYVRTACPTVFVGDSGELAAAVHTLGVAHPPGYPLYVLLGKLFSLVVPIGRPVYRLNLFSATMSAVSVGFMQATLSALGFSWPVSVASALGWAFSASLWSQSGIARVYALGAAISAAATWCGIYWYVDPNLGNIPLYAAFAIVGFGMANHPIAAAHVPALAALVGLKDPAHIDDPLFWMTCAACLLPGLALYAWIPLRARRGARVNWANIATPGDLVNFLRRKQYWRHRYVTHWREAWQVITFYLGRVAEEFGFLGAAAAVIGLPLLASEQLPLLVMVLVLVLLNGGAMIAHARREDIFHWTRYMLCAWFALVLPLAWGWNMMVSNLPADFARPMAFLLPVGLLVTRFRRHDLSRHRYADGYNRRILECLPEGATLIAQDDNVVFPLMYLKYAEGVRPDVKLLEQGVHQLGPLKFNPRRDAVYCTHWNAAFNQSIEPGRPGLRLVPEGVIYRVISTDMAYTPRDLWSTFLLPDMEDPRIPRNFLTRCLLGHMYFMRAEWAAMHGSFDALGWYERAARMGYDDATLNYNIALAYRRGGWQLAADEMFSRAAQLDRKFAPQPPGASPAAAPRPGQVPAVGQRNP
ncbi:MAG: DUF2723 domain-containing protein [Planctomycetia bacterium]|nr:DUF2723 domain-containing protein [Planctomycetia bacterium]